MATDKLLVELDELRDSNPIVAAALNRRRDFPSDQAMLIALIKALAAQNKELLDANLRAAQLATTGLVLVAGEFIGIGSNVVAATEITFPSPCGPVAARTRGKIVSFASSNIEGKPGSFRVQFEGHEGLRIVTRNQIRLAKRGDR